MATTELSLAALSAVSGVLGLAVGSFLNVVIRRLPPILERRWLHKPSCPSNEVPGESGASLSLALPSSHCPACGRYLKAWHKIPVLSYLLLRGRCGFCKASISIQYPVVELLGMAVSVITVAHFGASIQSLAALTFSWALIVLAFIDCNTRLLPDELTLGLLWAGLLAGAFGLFIDAPSAVLGATAGYASLWLIYRGMKLVTGREGLGYGDMKLLAAIGAWCGWQTLPFIVLAASVSGLAVAAVLLVSRRMKKNEAIPFGPYLAAAAWLFFIYGWPLPSSF